MRYKGYVVTYAGDGQKVNNENYFLNGVYKRDIEQKSYFDENRNFGTRNLYGLSGGTRCAEEGNELSRLSVELLEQYFGSDFNAENRAYFKETNDAIRSHIFEKAGRHFEVDTSVLYIEKDVARVYNIGSIPVFYFDGKNMKKLSGNSPETVDVEKNFLGEEGIVLTDVAKKKTVPFLGYADDECEAVPFVSEPVRLKKKGFVVLCSKAVVDVIGEKGILSVLKDKSIKACDKALRITDKAIEAAPDGTYSVEIVEVGHGIPAADTEVKSLETLVVASLICGLVFFMGSFVINPIVDFVDYCKTIVENIGTEEDSEGELKWIPKEDVEEEPIFNIFTNVPGDGQDDDHLVDEESEDTEGSQTTETTRPVQGPSQEHTEVQGPQRPAVQPSAAPSTAPVTAPAPATESASETVPTPTPEVSGENETVIDFT